MSADDAFKRWELENEIETDSVFEYPINQNHENNQPWLQDKKCFTETKMSASALLSIVSHAASSTDMVFGFIKGYYTGNTMVILEVVPLSSNRYTEAKDLPSTERVVGTYISHPGWGVWPNRMEREQLAKFPEPRLLISVDPVKTCKAGKVDIAAFRSIDNEDGCYVLKLSFFKSSLDSKILERLWNKYWGERLAESDLIMNNRSIGWKLDNIADLTEVAEEEIEKNVSLNNNQTSPWKVTETSAEVAVEQICAVYDEVVKLMMFSTNISNKQL